MGYRTTFWVNHTEGFYFRLRGYGVALNRDMPVWFSERVGAKKVLRLGRWAVTWLKRSDMADMYTTSPTSGDL